MFSQPLSTIKVNFVDKMVQNANLGIVLHVKHKKMPFVAVLTRFLILGKIQDGDHCWWCHRPPTSPPPIKYTSSCWEDQRLSTKGEIVWKLPNFIPRGGLALPDFPGLFKKSSFKMADSQSKNSNESILFCRNIDQYSLGKLPKLSKERMQYFCLPWS